MPSRYSVLTPEQREYHRARNRAYAASPKGRETNARSLAAYRQRALAPLRKMLGGVCQRCGTAAQLAFHHRDPRTKLFSIAGTSELSRPALELRREARKCELLCWPCHRNEHYGTGDGRAQGGAQVTREDMLNVLAQIEEDMHDLEVQRQELEDALALKRYNVEDP